MFALDAGALAFWLSLSVVGSLLALTLAVALGYVTANIKTIGGMNGVSQRLRPRVG